MNKRLVFALLAVNVLLTTRAMAQIPMAIPLASDRPGQVESETAASDSGAPASATSESSGSIYGLLPVASQDEAARFWRRSAADGGARFLTSGTVLFADEALESTIELASDIVGVFRLGVGLTVAAPRSSGADSASNVQAKQESTLSRLANSGGVVQVTAAVPLFHSVGVDTPSTWAALWTTTTATETPKDGGFLEAPAMTVQSGVELLYARQGLDDRIDVHVGVVARSYWLSAAYAEKAGLSKGLAFLIVPRVGLTLLDQTRLDLHWRLGRSSKFDRLGSVALSLQQITN